MKQRTKRVVTAWFMSLLMVLSVVMIPGGVAKAEGSNVEFYDAELDTNDATNKTLVYTIDGKTVKVQLGTKVEGVFTPVDVNKKNGNGRYEINCANVTDYYLKIINDNNAAYKLMVGGGNATVDADGYFTFTSAGTNGVISVQLQSENAGGGDNPPVENYEKGKLSFKSNGIAGSDFTYYRGNVCEGYIYYPYKPIEVDSEKPISLYMNIDVGFALDREKGVILHSGDASHELTDDEIGALLDDEKKYTIDLGDNPSQTAYWLEFSLLRTSNVVLLTGDSEENSEYIIKDGEPAEQYILDEVSDETGMKEVYRTSNKQRNVVGIGIRKDGDGYKTIIDGLNLNGSLLVTGNDIQIESAGNNTLNRICMADGMSLEIRPGEPIGKQPVAMENSNDKPVTTINAKIGIMGLNGKARRLGLRDDVKVVIGSPEDRSYEGFANIETLELYNYDFHKHGNYYNNEIYADDGLEDVDKVEAYYSTSKIDAAHLFSGDGNHTFELFQESSLTYNRDISISENDNIINRYYDHYPDNSKPFTGRTKNAGIIDFDEKDENGNLYVQSKDLKPVFKNDTDVTTDKDKYHYTLKANTNGTNTITSDDPIIYSVMYNVDDDGDGRKQLSDGRMLENGNCGQVEMKNFKKGYYITDGSHGKFEAWIAAGENVDVTILPNAGYQYIKNTLNINGASIETKASVSDDDVGKYSFTMPANAGHVCAGFAKTEDVIKVNSKDTNVSAATLSLDESEIKQGNAKLEIGKAEVTDNDKAKISWVVPDANENTVYEYMDVTLSESVVKNYDTEKENDEQTAWDKKLSELNEEATITLTLSDALRGFANYDVVRIHNGVAEKLNGVSIMSGGRLSFKTDKFSTYAIVGKNQPLYVQNGVDCSELKSGSYTVDGDTVTIDNLVQDVDAEYGELCLYGKEYGKTPMTLIVKGTNKVKNLIFDTKVNVICEKDASLSFTQGYFEGEFKTGGYTLGKDTVLEGNVFKYKSSETPQPQPQPAQQQPVTTVTPEPTPATVSEVGTEITPVEAAASQSTYEVTQKSTGSDGEVSYKGEATDSKATTVKILDTVTGKDGVTYKVTEIAENALKGNKKVKTVTMGKNIKVVRKNAFRNASKLTTVKLGDNVTKIEGNAFNGCKKLKSLTVKGKLTSVGKNAFKGVGKNTTITIVCKSKKEYKKIKKLLEKAGAKKAKFKHKKK